MKHDSGESPVLYLVRKIEQNIILACYKILFNIIVLLRHFLTENMFLK